MIVQISMVRDELPFIKALLPIWAKFSDGFIFSLDVTTDGTKEYLMSVKEKYNILEIIDNERNNDLLFMETHIRQELFDTALKYTSKIICLDADEYLDGSFSKEDLENLMDNNPNTLFHLQWIQYTSPNTIRVDGPWGYNLKDRIGNYLRPHNLTPAQSHSEHIPNSDNNKIIPIENLFIAHLQWVNKDFVAIKQYFWKVFDYVNNKLFNVGIISASAYDASVNNFNWTEINFNYPLKIDSSVFNEIMLNNYRINYISEMTKKYNIPNLGDWGYNFIK